MGKHTSLETKRSIVRLRNNGIKAKAISKQVGKSLTTIYNILASCKEDNGEKVAEKRGRKCVYTKKEKMFVIKEVKKTPQKSCREISDDFKICYNKNISKSTVWRTINKVGFRSFIPKKKPFLTENHMKKDWNFLEIFSVKVSNIGEMLYGLMNVF